jgi:hypothetical protein
MAKKIKTFGTPNIQKKGPLGGKHGTSAKKRPKLPRTSSRSPRKPDKFRDESSDDDEDTEDDANSGGGGSDAYRDQGDGTDDDDDGKLNDLDSGIVDDDSDGDSDKSVGEQFEGQIAKLMKRGPKLSKADVAEFATGVKKLLATKLKEAKGRQVDHTPKQHSKLYPMGLSSKPESAKPRTTTAA